MSKRDAFIAVVDTLKSTFSTITDDQRKRLLRQAVQSYELTADEATQILKTSGLVVGESVDYFEVLGLTIQELRGRSEADIVNHVVAAHGKLYSESLTRGSLPGEDKRRDLLNQARDTLTDLQKRLEHIAIFQPELTDIPSGGSARAIFEFPNGNRATSIPQLATLMTKNARDAAEALYKGNIEQSLRHYGEIHLANAAAAIVHQYSRNRNIGLMAMVAILRGKIRFQQGGEASTPQQLARLIDQNWEQAKRFLYSGFIPLWLEYIKQTQLAPIAKDITNRYRSKQDIGLEMLIQRLDPQIGKPKLRTSRSRIDFSRINTQSQTTIDFEIMNAGRGFLYGNVRLPRDIPWLQVSETEIRGDGVVSIELDTSQLTPNKTHETALVINTNGGSLTIPVCCNTPLTKTKVLPNVNAKDENGWTPLHSAALNNDYEKAHLLINNGADVNVKEKYGSTPLHTAARNNAHETAELLLKNGADVNAENNTGKTALRIAVEKNAHKMAELLRKHGGRKGVLWW